MKRREFLKTIGAVVTGLALPITGKVCASEFVWSTVANITELQVFRCRYSLSGGYAIFDRMLNDMEVMDLNQGKLAKSKENGCICYGTIENDDGRNLYYKHTEL